VICIVTECTNHKVIWHTAIFLNRKSDEQKHKNYKWNDSLYLPNTIKLASENIENHFSVLFCQLNNGSRELINAIYKMSQCFYNWGCAVPNWSKKDSLFQKCFSTRVLTTGLSLCVFTASTFRKMDSTSQPGNTIGNV